MADELTFSMGNYEARIPVDRVYSKNHLWLLDDAGLWKVGFTAYSVRLLQDVYFLDWTIDPQTEVRHKQEIGEIESSKALSRLYAPSEGTVLDFNGDLLDDPSWINTDNYNRGWLYTFRSKETYLDAEAYIEFLGESWEETQRVIKGQMN